MATKSSSRRFLILTQYFPPEIGASQARLSSLARELVRLGHSVEIVTAMPHHLKRHIYVGYTGKLYVHEIWNGIDVHRTWVYAASSNRVLQRLASYASFMISSFFGLSKCRRPDYLIVESPPLFLAITGMIYSWIRIVPMILNVSDLWPDSVRLLGVMREGISLRLAERLESVAYRRATYINAITEGVRTALLSEKGVRPCKLLFFPNGVDTDEFRPVTSDASLVEHLKLKDKIIIIYAGTHGIAYRLDLLIEVALILEPHNVVFLLVGDGFTKPALQANVVSLKLTNVIFLDAQPYEDMPRYFSIAYASIIPLARNSLFLATRPAKLFPSWACGVPVIYSGEGEGADLTSSAKAGIVIPPESPKDLIEAILTLVQSPDLRTRFSQNGRDFVVSYYSWKSIVHNWLAELRDRENLVSTSPDQCAIS